ncbi:MAG: glycosyltransferase family 9 protein [Chitinophagaceae bacterium]|nr:MAG: glycosyltransferase family 9 protein [Chitinophagaceae bacterium]
MSTYPRHILVLRFSALGDVAMTVPVIRNLLVQNPSLEITFASVPFVEPLFDGMPRLHFYPVDIKNEFRGFAGLYRLAKKIKSEVAFDAIADVHDVLRTKILRFFLGRPTQVIDKGRKEKRELTRAGHKKLRPLKTGFQRYADVFLKFGIELHLDINTGINKPSPNRQLLPADPVNNRFIGIAPFAKHSAKMYPLTKMEQVVDLLLMQEYFQIIVFTSKEERQSIESWVKKSPRIHVIGGSMNLADELNLMSQMQVMITMDSANMHLASLSAVPVVSVWGGTHPFLGFLGWGQDYENVVQTDLPCRPSSVFGNKDCPVHGAAGCMQEITPLMLYEKAMSLLK